MQDAPQHEICVHRERRIKEYVMPTHAPKKEMPAMMSIKTSDPESSARFDRSVIQIRLA